MSEKRVIFRCTLCEAYNREEVGTPAFVKRRIEYDSLTEMWDHMVNYYHCQHNIIAVVREEEGAAT